MAVDRAPAPCRIGDCAEVAKNTTPSLITRLGIAAIAMILLGYPGEIAAADSSTRTICGILSTLPFRYILFVLFVELGKSLDRQTEQVRKIVNGLRFMILAKPLFGLFILAIALIKTQDEEGSVSETASAASN